MPTRQSHGIVKNHFVRVQRQGHVGAGDHCGRVAGFDRLDRDPYFGGNLEGAVPCQIVQPSTRPRKASAREGDLIRREQDVPIAVEIEAGRGERKAVLPFHPNRSRKLGSLLRHVELARGALQGQMLPILPINFQSDPPKELLVSYETRHLVRLKPEGVTPSLGPRDGEILREIDHLLTRLGGRRREVDADRLLLLLAKAEEQNHAESRQKRADDHP